MDLSIFFVGNKIIVFRTKQCIFEILNIHARSLTRIKPAADQVLSISALLAGIQCTILTMFESIGKVFCPKS